MKLTRYIIFGISLTFLCGCTTSSKPKHTLNIKDIAPAQNTYPAVILGGGVGGLTAAVYLGQAGLEPIVIEGATPGGLITQSSEVRNWPGEIKISGHDLANKIREHALKSGAQILKQKIISFDVSSWPYKIQTCDILDEKQIHEIKALSCIIAMGTQPNLLNVPGESGPDGYFGKGITTCAICDGALYKDKVVAVIGGGNSAMEEAAYLSSLAKKVFIIVRSDKLRASHLEQELVRKKSNIEILFNKKVIQVSGNGTHVTSIILEDTKQDVNSTTAATELPIDGIFLAIGSTPNTQLFKSQLKLDNKGFIKLYKHQETSTPGVFAAGDIADKKFKQAVTAAGHATECALQAMEFLQKVGYTHTKQTKPEKAADLLVAEQPITEITSEKQFDDVLNSVGDKLVVADFYATYCVPCQNMMPILKKLAAAFTTQAVFVKINVSENGPIAEKFELDSVPVFLFFKNGKIVQKFVGAKSYEFFEDQIKHLTANSLRA